MNSDHFYQTFGYSASLSSSSSTTQLLDSLTINEGGLVFIEGTFNASVQRYTCSSNVSFSLLDDTGQGISINTITGLSLSASNCNSQVTNSEYRSGSFIAVPNQKIYIYGSYSVSGYNNYQNQGGNSGSFNIAIYK